MSVESDTKAQPGLFRVMNVSEINNTSRVLPTWLQGASADEENALSSEPSINGPEVAPSSVKVKAEPQDDAAAGPSHTTDTASPPIAVKTEVKVKEEPTEAAVSSSSEPAANAVSAPTTTSQRPCCRFGVRCYRRNVVHRAEEAHPGDPDYRMPEYPEPPNGTPKCPFGLRCYRRNPSHFQSFSHSLSPQQQQNVAANMNNTRLQEGNQRTSTYSMEDDDSVMGSIDSDVDEYDSSDYLGTTSEDDGVDSSQDPSNNQRNTRPPKRRRLEPDAELLVSMDNSFEDPYSTDGEVDGDYDPGEEYEA